MGKQGILYNEINKNKLKPYEKAETDFGLPSFLNKF